MSYRDEASATKSAKMSSMGVRAHRASGGRVKKGSTTVNIVVQAPQGGGDDPMKKMALAAALAGPQAGAGAPPPPMPPAGASGPPQPSPGPASPGMKMGGRVAYKKGGRVKPDMDADDVPGKRNGGRAKKC